MESPAKATAKKTLNKVKTALKARAGPGEKDQSRSPFADAIARYWENPPTRACNSCAWWPRSLVTR